MRSAGVVFAIALLGPGPSLVGCAIGITPDDGGGRVGDAGGDRRPGLDAGPPPGDTGGGPGDGASDTGGPPGMDAPSPPIDTGPPPPGCADTDGDGYGVGAACRGPDCDDTRRNVHPGATETCNGLDDDCNGMVDDGLGMSTCGTGGCMRTVANCMGGMPQTCTPGAPSAEVCNGRDDNCNGAVDEGLPSVSCGVGPCMRTVSSCAGGVPQTCTPLPPGTETCNGRDDDCDGVVDNGFRAAVVNTTYTTLSASHPVCNGTTERMGPSCNAAISRYCGGRGCTTSGFGPVENAGDTAVVTCVIAEPARTTSYTTLSASQPACNGSTERVGPNCNAAVHRWCVGQGYTSGFGPVENSGDTAIVVCVRAGPATVVNTTYTTLRTFHPACDGSTERWGPDCNAAIHRFCRSTGRESGFGPVENSGDTAYVVCVSS